MSKRIAPLIVLLLAACAPTVDVAVEEQAIRDVSASWMALDGQKDAAGVAALFADDGAVYWEQRQPVHGRDEIRAHMETAYLENPSGEGEFGPDRIEVSASGDLAVELGAYRNPGGQGRYITVHQKSADEWQILADMSVGTTPNGGAPEWAVQSLADWYVAYNGRDAGGIADLYTSDAQIGDAQGRSAIMASFEAGWIESDDNCSGMYDGFRIVDDIAAGWGRDFCTDSGGDLSSVSNWLTFHERQTDGSWLMIRDRGQPIE